MTEPWATNAVPCNGCTLCCRNDLIVLHPDEGDDPSQYETVAITNPLTGKGALALNTKPNGECTYLGPNGCTIYERRPLICREFDCRRMYLRIPRAERRKAVKIGFLSAGVLDAGRKRIGSLSADDIALERSRQ